MNKFVDQMKDYLDKGVAASKTAIDKAGVVMQGLGELGVLKIELEKLNSKKRKFSEKLGSTIYQSFVVEKKEQVLASDESITAIINELKQTEKDIVKHQKAIKDAEKNTKGTKKAQ